VIITQFTPELFPFCPGDCASEWQAIDSETTWTATVSAEQRYVPSAPDCEWSPSISTTQYKLYQ